MSFILWFYKTAAKVNNLWVNKNFYLFKNRLDLHRNEHVFIYICGMDTKTVDTVKRLLIRLEDARSEVKRLADKVEYPMDAKVERAYDAIETAEKYLGELISK